MILILHQDHQVLQIKDTLKSELLSTFKNESLAQVLYKLAKQFPDRLIMWCHKKLEHNLNLDVLSDVFHHKLIFATFHTNTNYYLPAILGYIDRSFHLKINRKVAYPTWIASSHVGGVHSSVINTLPSTIFRTKHFDYLLHSISKSLMIKGLFCYSDPRLLKDHYDYNIETKIASTGQLFKFVKQHYKWVWVYFLTLSLCVYEKRLPIVALLKTLFYKQQHLDFNLGKVKINSLKQVNTTSKVDVIIPTIGRKKYLYDVLVDLSKQTLLPKTVVIVEQNPEPNSTSELDYLTTQDWPFIINHTFTHKTGVCNARNIALSKTQSEWVLLGDDDNRFNANLIESLLDSAINYGIKAATTVYLQPHEKQTFMDTAQTSIFGAGNTLIHSSLLKTVKFDMSYEFNYGEDTDFGMQIRNQGEDVVFFSDIKITHLKAPFGGYRTKVKQLWDHEEIPPKPSPPIYLLYNTYFTKKQLLGYKLLLGLKSYKKSKIKNPITFIKDFYTKWKISEKWSQELAKNND